MAMAEELEQMNLNVCIVGHVDSGKSTTVGNLAYQLGVFDERQLTKLKLAAEAQGRDTFAYAYFFDNTDTEREKGITIDATLKQFKLKKFSANIIDCPGHKDFIKNMVTGAAQADVAVALVPASEFEKATSTAATLRDHIVISGAMGVKNLVICVNKMDFFPESEQKEKFEWMKKELLFMVPGKLHTDRDPIIIPISGLKGINIADKGEKFPWFEGWQKKDGTGEKVFTLEGALNYFEPPKRPIDRPLRMPITDICSITGIGTIYTGRVDSGYIVPSMSVTIQPASVFGEVKSIQTHRKERSKVYCGENIGLALKSGTKGDISQIKKGNVISDAKNSPCAVYPACEARVIMVSHPKGVQVGYCPVMDLGTHHVPAKIAKIISCKNPKEKEVRTEGITKICNRDCAVCILVPQKPIVMEVLNQYPSLSRFALRDGGSIVAIGSIVEVLTKEKCDGLGVDVSSVMKAVAPQVGGASSKDKKK